MSLASIDGNEKLTFPAISKYECADLKTCKALFREEYRKRLFVAFNKRNTRREFSGYVECGHVQMIIDLMDPTNYNNNYYKDRFLGNMYRIVS